MKKCSKCGELKALDRFYKDKNSKDGITYKCKTCHVKASKQRYQKNKKRLQKHYREKYIPVEKVVKICPLCGNKFLGNDRVKYCSKNCSKEGIRISLFKSYHRNKNKKRFEYICKGCGKKDFTYSKNRMNYCTHECYSKNAPHLRNKK